MIRWIFLLCCIHYGQAVITTDLGYFPDWWPSTKVGSRCLGASCDCIKNNKCNETIECSRNNFCGCPAGHVVQWAVAPQPEYRFPASNYWPTGNYYWLEYRGFNCLLCPAGKYSNSASGTRCNSCKTPVPDGGINGEWDISLRDVGYSTAGSSGCSATCPNNTYMMQASSYSNACLDTCPVNTYILPDQKRCIKCSSGKYLIQPYFSNGANESFWCKYCPGGWHPEKVSGSVKCIECAAGRWTDKYPLKKNGFPNCLSSRYDHQNDSPACTVGKYGTPGAFNESGCVSCPTGFYQGQIASSTCNECAENKLTGVPTGASHCDKFCPSNGYINIDEACIKCPEGKYLNASNGDTACKDCPDAAEPYSNGVSCFACLPGHARSCSKCPPGRYTGWEAVDECHQCGQGYQDEHGQGNCKQCPAGRVSSTDYTTCVTCPFGKYSDEVDLITCKTCPSGLQHTGIIGQKDSKCTGKETIGKDTYNASDDASYQGFQESLYKVADGTYTAETTNCAKNKYKNTFGGSCKACPQGLYNGADDPSIKIVGINDWANPCKFCPAGEVSTSGTCTKCPISPNQGILRDYPSEECRYAACPSGSSALDGECSECPAGTYWDGLKNIGLHFNWKYNGIFHDCEQFKNQFEQPWVDLVGPCNYGKDDDIQICQDWEAGVNRIACEWGQRLHRKRLHTSDSTYTATGTYTGLCRQCPLGQYQDLPGQVTCKYCHDSTSTGSTSCAPLVVN